MQTDNKGQVSDGVKKLSNGSTVLPIDLRKLYVLPLIALSFTSTEVRIVTIK